MTEHNDPPPVQTHQHDDGSSCIMFADFNGCTIGDLADALAKVPREDEVVRLEITYFPDDDEAPGQRFPDDEHQNVVVNIRTEAMLCPDCTADNAAVRVVDEAEALLLDPGDAT